MNGTNLATDNFVETIKVYDAQQKTADDKYLVSTTTNTRTNGTVTTDQVTNKPLSEQIEDAEKNLVQTVTTLLAQPAVSFDEESKKLAKDSIKECIEIYKSGNVNKNLESYLVVVLAIKGFNTTELKRRLSNMDPTGYSIYENCKVLSNAIKSNSYENASENITAPIVKTINGVNFQFTTANGTTPSHKVEVDENGYIVVEASNCTINVLGAGESEQKVRVTGSNLTFNSNNLTLKEIINYAKNSTINGSHGNDTIINQTTGSGSTINSLGGDDAVTNYGINTKFECTFGIQ